MNKCKSSDSGFEEIKTEISDEWCLMYKNMIGEMKGHDHISGLRALKKSSIFDRIS